ncbi:MAG: FtsX-like permease family protein [Acidobacteriaceae bacterium]|nr:FtsX-like permease family protein [Acidobacteriaceae bacterium]
MNRLVFGNLVHRPLRSLISALAIAIEVIMILSVTGIFLGKLEGSKQRQNGIGMDMIIRPPASSAISAFSSASSSIKIADIVAQIPHVAVAAPVNLKVDGLIEQIYGINFKSFNALQPFTFVSGTPFQGPNDVIIDDYAGAGKKVGDTIQLLDHPFRICGIVEHGKGARKFIPIETMGKLTGTEGKATVFYLRTEAPPRHQEEVRKAILAIDGMSDYKVSTAEELFSELTPARLPGFNTAIYVVVGISLVIGFLVIFQSMYTAVMERTREIGILKSMGASRSYIVSTVLREAALLAAAGIALGVAASLVLAVVLDARFPTLDFAINLPWVWKAVVIALVGALLGAMYPALKAASKDPIDALAYE